MEHQKILNLLIEANDPKFVTRKQNIVDSNSKSSYDATNGITSNTEVLKSNFNANIANTDNFKPFKYKAK